MSIKQPWGASSAQRQQTANNMILRGGSKTPQPPRSVIAQPGNSKVILSWSVDPSNDTLCSTRIYADTESNMVDQCAPGVNTTTVPANAGVPRAIYISSVTPALVESRKIFVICAAAPAGSPDPAPPTGPGSGTSGGGGTGAGGGTTYGGGGTGSRGGGNPRGPNPL